MEHHPLRKPEYFYREVAKNLGMDYKTVRDVNKWYWSQGIRKNMANTAHRSLYVKYFGTVTISRKKLYAEIYKELRAIRFYINGKKYISEAKRQEIIEAKKLHLKQMLYQRNLLAIENKANKEKWKIQKQQREEKKLNEQAKKTD